jgi:hypothetical protein
MREPVLRPLPGALLFALGALGCDPAAAQTGLGQFHLGSWDGKLEAGYETEHQRSSVPGGDDTRFSLQQFREQLTLRNAGFYYVDPRLAVGTMELTFGKVQESESADGRSSSSHASLIGYAFDTAILPTQPYSANVFANRSESITSQPFGRSDIIFENRGVRLHLGEDSVFRKKWGVDYLSANLRAEQQVTNEETTSVVGQTFRRDELRSILGFDGHDGLRMGDLDWRYEFSDYSDASNIQNNFRSQNAAVNYSMDFGRDLNRRWDSREYFYTRDGRSRYTTATAGQHVQWQHANNLSTDYQYQFAWSETSGGSSTSNSGGIGAHYSPYRNLATDARLSASAESLPQGERRIYEARAGAQYHRSLPWSAYLSVHATGGVQLNDNQLTATRIDVTDERHSAPAALGAGSGFLLDRSFALEASIVVIDARGGSRLPATLGLDYDVVTEGDQLRIEPLITSAVIQPNDPLLVSYSYQLDPSIRYRTDFGSVGTVLDFGWVLAEFDHEQSSQTLLSGHDGQFLQDLRKETARLALRGTWRSLRGQAGADYVIYDSTRLVYDQSRLYSSALYRPVRNIDLGLNADWTVTDYSLPSHHTDGSSIQATVNWFGTRRRWSLTGLAGHRVFKDTLQPTETVNEASVKGRLDYGKLALTSTLSYDDRTRGRFRNDIWRIQCTVTRSF